MLLEMLWGQGEAEAGQAKAELVTANYLSWRQEEFKGKNRGAAGGNLFIKNESFRFHASQYTLNSLSKGVMIDGSQFYPIEMTCQDDSEVDNYCASLPYGWFMV